MTTILAAAVLASIAFEAGWLACTRYHRALRLDRDLHEQSHHMNGDTVRRLERHLRHMIADPRIAIRAHTVAERRGLL